MESFNNTEKTEIAFREPTLKERDIIAKSQLYKEYSYVFALLFGIVGIAILVGIFSDNLLGMIISIPIWILLTSLITKTRIKIKRDITNNNYKVISGKCIKKDSRYRREDRIYTIDVLAENNEVQRFDGITKYQYNSIAEGDNIIVVKFTYKFSYLTLFCKND